MIRLDEKYNRDDFIAFLSNAFFADFTRDIRPIHTQNLSAIEKAYSLGKSNKLDLQIFEFEYAGSSKKRVALTKEAFKIMQDSLNYQALAIFHGKENDDWRLSLMILNPKKTDTGKVSISYSNPRRYSYFLGPNAKINTPHRFLIKAGQIKDFDDLQSRFNVEIVTKEFFENYKKLFDRLLAYLQKDHAFQAFANNNGINTANFAKKLLGQIVFLYFLQRKGWLGAKKGDSVSQGDKNFIRALFNQSREKGVNFYNTYLEPLFYGALNKPAEKAASYYRDYFDSQIPFLNGGLFEPPQNYDWEKSFLHIPDKVFSKDPKNPEHGDGILDIFDMYNFTVDESDFLDKEVSVDPEMLGKVFENLLEENLRKGKGTYYTPREIVNYMCEESLVNFLATETNLAPDDVKNKYFPAYNILGDEKIEARDVATSEQIIESLKGIKVVDPACGSGAFLVGMLQQITHLRHELEIRSQILGKRTTASSEYEIKKDTIQNCIHGVDIDPGAIEIAKLRLWLSLVVDYELEEIEPLPNLDYKIMQGNSLLEELVLGDTIIKLYDSSIIKKTTGSKRMQNLFEEETRVGLFDDEKEQVIKTMKILQLEYFKASDNKEKKRLKQLIDKVEHDLIETSVKLAAKELQNQKINIKTLPGIGLLDQDVKKLQKISNIESQIFAVLDELKKTGTKPFFLWHLYFADVFEENGGFDVIIANPPYISHDKIQNKSYFQSIYLAYQAFADMYCFFIELGMKLQSKNGTLCFITSNSFLRAEYGKPLRKLISNQNSVLQLVNIEKFQIFESAIVNTCVLMSQKKHVEKATIVNQSLSSATTFDEYVALYGFKYSQNELNSEPWLLLNEDVLQIKNKIASKGKTLKEYGCKIRLGLATGANEVFLIDSKRRKEFLSLDGKNNEIIKPVLRGRDINRFNYKSPNSYILLTKNGIDLKADYPKIYEYLDSFGESFKNRGAQGQNWWNLRACAFFNDFKEEKIVWIELTDKGRFALCNEEIYLVNSAYFLIPPKEFIQEYLLAILNSKVIMFYLKNISETSGMGTARWININVERFPIVQASESKQNEIKKIVTKITDLISVNNSAVDFEKNLQIKEYEKHIDQLVYELYDLTPGEIAIVEGGKNES